MGVKLDRSVARDAARMLGQAYRRLNRLAQWDWDPDHVKHELTTINALVNAAQARIADRDSMENINGKDNE